MSSTPASTVRPVEFHPTGAAPRPYGGAYELKFLVPEDRAEELVAWARSRVPADPHAGPDGTYEIRSLYLDTPNLDVYHRRPGYAEARYRIRRYGTEDWLFLERKSRIDRWVRKQRTRIECGELDWVQEQAPEDWSGAWFGHQLRQLGLQPRCRIAYRRVACVGETEGQPVRLTLDRQLRCGPAACLDPDGPGETRPIPGLILELKFRGDFPRLFEELVRSFSLEMTSASKYRRAVELCRSWQ